MTKIGLGDFYPFRTSLHLSVEGGSRKHSGRDVRSGIVFYYGESGPSMFLTDYIDAGDISSERVHDLSWSFHMNIEVNNYTKFFRLQSLW